MIVRKLLAVLALAGVAFVLGCESDLGLGGGGDDGNGLPKNPEIPGYGTSARQRWHFIYKDYDHSWRIRWPTYFADKLGDPAASWCTVNGERAPFRNFDTDHGKRASYRLPGPRRRLSGPVICILYSSDGKALGWFQATAPGPDSGWIR